MQAGSATAVLRCTAAVEEQLHPSRRLVLRAGKSADEVRAVLAESRRLLHERRAQRPRPHLDDKVLNNE